MTDIITAAVRAGCETFYPKTCLYPDCACPNRRGDDRHGLETAALLAADAAAEIDPRDAELASLRADLARLVEAARGMTECDLGLIPDEGCTCASCEAWHALTAALAPFKEPTP